MQVDFAVHESHAPLWERNNWRYAVIMGGRGNGRSGSASRFIISSLLGKDYVRGALMRAVHSDIRTSSWLELNDRLSEQGIVNSFQITDNDMHIERGRNSFHAHGFRASSGSLTARLKSLAGYNMVWIEEAEEIGEKEFMTLDDSLRTVKGNIRIILTLNPPAKDHWIIRRWFDLEPARVDGFAVDGFYKPRLKNDASDVIYLPGTYRENLPNLDKATVTRYEAYRDSKPAYYWQMIEGLVPEVVRGRIYSGWKITDQIPHNARLVRFGIDFGWSPDPVCAVAVYYYDGGYIIDEVVYGTEISNKLLAEKILSYGQKALTIADSAEPKSIEEIASYGVQIVGAEKGHDSVSYGIKVVSDMRISVTRRSKNVWQSYENYSWAEDKEGNSKGYPNHYLSDPMDAVRYALTSIKRIGGTEPDVVRSQEVIFTRNKHRQNQNDTR